MFKIQANMDPRHHDRIVFFRVCSGRYTPAMKVKHLRLDREMKIANAQTFMANERLAGGAVPHNARARREAAVGARS